MKKNHRVIISFLLPLILLIITILTLIPYKKALIFEQERTAKILAYIPFSKDLSFKIKYTHSIHLSDVVESYQVKTDDGQIRLYELHYEDFAIGMPSGAEKGEIFEMEDGGYTIKNMNRLFPYFDLRIGQVKADHKLIYDNEEYLLSQYIEPGTLVRVKSVKLNLVQQLKGVNIIDE